MLIWLFTRPDGMSLENQLSAFRAFWFTLFLNPMAWAASSFLQSVLVAAGGVEQGFGFRSGLSLALMALLSPTQWTVLAYLIEHEYSLPSERGERSGGRAT
jgi:hypothetical protein